MGEFACCSHRRVLGYGEVLTPIGLFSYATNRLTVVLRGSMGRQESSGSQALHWQASFCGSLARIDSPCVSIHAHCPDEAFPMSLDRRLRLPLRGDGGWSARARLSSEKHPGPVRWSPGRRIYRAQKADRRSKITTRLAEERG